MTERSHQLATMAAALLVGAALVILWPRPDPAPALNILPTPGAEARDAPASPPAQPRQVQPRQIQPPAPQQVLDPSLLQAHVRSAGGAWLALARQAEAAPDQPTRALAPALHQLAAMAPQDQTHPPLQPTAALLLAELGLVEALEASSLDAGDLLAELRAIRSGWIGEMPVAAAPGPR